MARLADSNGFKYFHFLQPNQYYKESKIFTDEEKTIAITQGEHPWRTSVELAYDLLIKEGDNLKEGGVNFTNLIMMFKNERRTVYIDNCCHFNRYGYDQIAIKIAAIIADNY